MGWRGSFSEIGAGARAALAVAVLLTLLFAFGPMLPAWRLFDEKNAFLAFHQVTEWFAIVVAVLIFAVGWHSHDRERPRNLSILSACFLGVALLDMFHTLSYDGMPDFVSPSDVQKGLNFWLAARVMAAGAVLAVAILPWRPFRLGHARSILLAGVLAVVALVAWAAILHLDALPATYVRGQGLTQWKVGVEWAVIAMLGAAIPVLWRNRELANRHWLVAAAWIMILSELYFTAWQRTTDVFNVLGHLYKCCGYGLLYQGVFVAVVRDPYRRLATSRTRLAESEARVRAIIQGSMDAFVAIDANRVVVAFNAAAAAMLGPSAERVLGRRLDEAGLPPQLALWLSEALARGSIRREDLEAERGEGRRLLAETNLFAVGEGEGRLAVASLRDVTELRQAEALERRRAAEVATLHNLGLRMGATVDLDQLVHIALEETLATAGADMAMLLLRDADGKPTQRGMLWRGVEPADSACSELGECLCLKAFASGEALYSNQLAQEQGSRLMVCAALGLNGFMALPLGRGDQVVGVLAVGTRDTSGGMGERLRFLETLGNEISGFLHNGLLYAELHRRGEELARINATLAAEVTERKHAEALLTAARDELETRVVDRTRSLQQEVNERQFAEESLRAALEDLERNQQELRLAKDAADNANQAKSDFLSSMSHELRTPLNAILGFAQLLESTKVSPLTEKQRSQVQYIIKGGQHLLQLINEVLDLARIEAGKMALSIEEVEAKPLLDEVLDLTRAYAGDKVRVRDWVIDGEPSRHLKADYTRFKQVLLNLTSNAVKYGSAGGTVTLAVEPGAPGMVRFVVADDGQGIAPDKQAQLFQPFSRLGAEATDIEGTGIGLTISKRLVEAMGGSIGFETELGRGSTFWVEVPAAAPVAVRVRELASAAAPSVRSGMGSRTMLYVEDNPANVQLMQELVAELADLTLITSTTAEVGLELAAVAQPDLILLDINLPGMNGVEAVRRLKADAKTRHIPVFALSANVTAGTIRQAMEAGVVKYLTKPLDVQAFFAAIEEVLQPAAG